MERDVPTVFLIFLIVFGTATLGLSISKVVYVNDPKDWWAARDHCGKQHSDLVTIRNAQQAERLAPYKGWIGLKHESNENWKWSNGDKIPTYMPPDIDKYDMGSRQCVFGGQPGTWEADQCEKNRTFICSDESLVLVEEMKTWEGALQHCAALRIPNPTLQHKYVLTDLSDAASVLWNTTALKAVTDEVWVTLRFLAGNWLWMSKEAVTRLKLPTCPAQHQFCGAVPYNSTEWKLLSCNEKRSFICRIIN